MLIKIIQKYQDMEIGTVVDVDEKTADEMINAKSGVKYDEVVISEEKKQLEQSIKDTVQKEIKKMETEVKGTALEVKDGATIVTKEANQGWKNGAEFLMAVKKAAEGRGFDSRLEVKAATGIGEDSSPLVTPAFVSDVIYKQAMQAATVFPKMTQYKIAADASSTALVKQFNETGRNNTSTFGGIRIYKVTEGSAITPSTPGFTQKSVTLGKAAALVYMSNESMRDIVNIVDQTAAVVGQSFAWQIDSDVVNGSLSIADPIVGNAATVAKTLAGTYPTAVELFEMYNSVLPAYRDGAEWYMSGATYARVMALGAATSGYPLFNRMAQDTDKQTILGKKVNVCEWATASNTAGQLLFGNPAGHYFIEKESMQAAASIHVAFLTDQQVFRWVWRYASCSQFASKLLLPDGNYYSYFVSRNTA